MSMSEFDLFVPGRLCILGEHTDWAAEYRSSNVEVKKGYTLVCATNEGLYAKVSSLSSLLLKYSHANTDGSIQTFESPLDFSKLKEQAAAGGFYCYVAGTAAAVLSSVYFTNKYSDVSILNGIEVDNYRTTLPMKKGLSSSASICVLIATAMCKFYQLEVTSQDLMELAYIGEMNTPSHCGRMDQCVVMGPDAVGVMEFDNSKCVLTKLKCSAPLYFVVFDLNASKDTMVILRELNSCFPLPANDTQALMLEYVSSNVTICNRAMEAIESGDVSTVAACMRDAQNSFNRCAIPNCPSQLTAPVLHRVINDCELNELALAVKGVGSQGDGTVQMLCASTEKQQEILRFMKDKYGMSGFTITIPSSTSV